VRTPSRWNWPIIILGLGGGGVGLWQTLSGHVGAGLWLIGTTAIAVLLAWRRVHRLHRTGRRPDQLPSNFPTLQYVLLLVGSVTVGVALLVHSRSEAPIGAGSLAAPPGAIVGSLCLLFGVLLVAGWWQYRKRQ
jgi:protein-S-isoprenylcysteine O-methyltransferase Ste14